MFSNEQGVLKRNPDDNFILLQDKIGCQNEVEEKRKMDIINEHVFT